MGERNAWIASVVFEAAAFIAAIAAVVVAWDDNRTLAVWSVIVVIAGLISTKVRVPLLNPATMIAGVPLLVYAITDDRLWALCAAVVSLVLYVAITLVLTETTYRNATSGGIPQSTLDAITARGAAEQRERARQFRND